MAFRGANVYRILQSRDGTMWVATRGGPARFNPNQGQKQPAFDVYPLKSRTRGRLTITGGLTHTSDRTKHSSVSYSPVVGLASGQNLVDKLNCH
jgi:hypothetical protein